ncbi:MAG: hypothetical protein Q8L68_02245 [Methylococcales bacterium]|nr:hypothetical protein [Methylococcales bacterium]
MIRWLGILLLFICPIISFFLLQYQSGEKEIWKVVIGVLCLCVNSVFLFFYLLLIEKFVNPRLDSLENKKSQPKENLKRIDNDVEQEKVNPVGLFKNRDQVNVKKVEKTIDEAGGIEKTPDKKKKSILAIFWEGHDRSVLKEIRKKVEEIAGESIELSELYKLSDRIDNKTYDDEGGFWSVVNHFRDIPLEISQFQIDTIKIKISELELKNQEHGLKDAAEPGQKPDEMSSSQKNFGISSPTYLSPTVDSPNNSQEDAPPSLISDKDANSNDQFNQEDTPPLSNLNQNE